MMLTLGLLGFFFLLCVCVVITSVYFSYKHKELEWMFILASVLGAIAVGVAIQMVKMSAQMDHLNLPS